MVLLDEDLDALEIYEADRPTVLTALATPGSRARNERGALAVSKIQGERTPSVAPPPLTPVI
jgi:hypothetical protein